MREQTKLEKLIDWIYDRTPCWLLGHNMSWEHKSGEVIYLNAPPADDSVCTKCGKTFLEISNKIGGK